MTRRNAFCSFCRKSHQEVGPLVEGPDYVYICSECISLCQSIIDQERQRRSATPPVATASDPQSIRATLDRLIPRQDDAKTVLVEGACRRHEGNGRVLLVGENLSGAMFLAKAMSHAFDVPFAAGVASQLSVTGKGSLFFELLVAAAFDLGLAQRGVVYISGMEKPEAQDALLRIWEANVCDLVSSLRMELRNLLFVCVASFEGLDNAIARLGRHPEQQIDAQTLNAVGTRPEWVAAFSAMARVTPLDEESLLRIVNCIDFRLD